MSFTSISNSTPTVTAAELEASAEKSGFTIPEGADNTAFLLLQNSFDATASSIACLPSYTDPRLLPTPTENGQRNFTRASPSSNPLNAWSHRTVLRASNPTSNLLSGKTLAIKDNISVASAPLVLGTSPELFRGGRHPISTIDATVVKRVLQAGGTILGTAVCENLSLFPVSVSAETGPVHNAWKKGYVTGGSSSGCGALVSAKHVIEWKKAGRRDPFPVMSSTEKEQVLAGNEEQEKEQAREGDEKEEQGVDLALGGDQGGSIRLPASYSGIYGLKPTTGLVPYTGIVSLLPMLDTTGPMARSIEDTALLLTVIAGADDIDFRQTPRTPLRENVPNYHSDLASWVEERKAQDLWTPSTAAQGLRIGILTEAFAVPGLDPAVASLVHASAERFSALGAQVKEISIPFHTIGPALWTLSGREAIPRFFENRATELLSHTLPGLDPLPVDQNFYDKLARKNPAVVNLLLNSQLLEDKYGPGLSRKCHMLIHQLLAAYDAALEDVDVLITPATPTVGFKHPVSDQGGEPGVMDIVNTAVGVTLNLCPFNLTGHPALVMPCGWAMTPDGVGKLPVGMQIVGRRWGEADVFRAATAWEVGGKGLDAL